MSVELECVGLKGSLESGGKLAAEDTAEHFDGKEVRAAGGNPAGVIWSEAARGKHAVDMGMMLQSLVPGMEHTEEAEIGFFSVLHTWNQRLQHHPHVHCVLAAGGLAPDHSRWISSRRSYFLPVKVLSRVFRGKFAPGLKAAFEADALQFHGHLLPLAEPRAFASWLRVLFRHDWVVYSKPPFGGPEHVLRYLGAYTHRVAISNSRLVALSDGNVTFRWRDSAHGNQKRLMTLTVDEFLRRFLLHLLPRGFVRIRNFGFLANRQRALMLPLCFRLLQTTESVPVAAVALSPDRPHSPWKCPLCGARMHVLGPPSAVKLL